MQQEAKVTVEEEDDCTVRSWLRTRLRATSIKSDVSGAVRVELQDSTTSPVMPYRYAHGFRSWECSCKCALREQAYHKCRSLHSSLDSPAAQLRRAELCTPA